MVDHLLYFLLVSYIDIIKNPIDPVNHIVCKIIAFVCFIFLNAPRRTVPKNARLASSRFYEFEFVATACCSVHPTKPGGEAIFVIMPMEDLVTRKSWGVWTAKFSLSVPANS